MKMQTVGKIVGLVVAGWLVTPRGYAAETGLYLSADAGVNLIGDLTDGPGTISFGPGFRADMSVGYTFLANETLTLSAAGETGFLYNTIDEASALGVTQSIDGDIYQIPFLGKIVLTFMPDSKWNPYVGFGGGGVYSRLEITSVGGTPIGSTGDETDPAFQGEGGINYKFNENSSAGLAYKCLIVTPEGIDEIINHSIVFNFVLAF